MARIARWTLRTRGIFDRRGRDIYCLRLTGSKCAPRQRRACRGGRCALFVAEFLLVSDGRHCRRVLGLGIGLYEYGQPVGSGAHGISYSLDRGTIRLDDLVPSGSWVVRGRCRELAGRGSIAATHGPTGRCPAARWFATPIGPIAGREFLKSVELRRAAHRVGCPSRTKRGVDRGLEFCIAAKLLHRVT